MDIGPTVKIQDDTNFIVQYQECAVVFNNQGQQLFVHRTPEKAQRLHDDMTMRMGCNHLLRFNPMTVIDCRNLCHEYNF